MSKAQPVFLIVVHDVAAPFLGELRIVFEHIRELVGSRFAAAVVPRWHGTVLNASDEIVTLVADCDEILLHGQTHFRQDNPGLISRMTNRSDELRGLSTAAIQQRIDHARDELAGLTGVTAHGLLPPAWQLPVSANELQRLAYVMRFGQLESCHLKADVTRLATWSFDWGWLKQAGRFGDLLGHAQWMVNTNAIPCIAIHPIDVTRGWLPRIEQLIRHFLDRGYEPTVPGRLVTCPQVARSK